MRLVKAAKASPHAKFYNLSTGYVGLSNSASRHESGRNLKSKTAQ